MTLSYPHTRTVDAVERLAGVEAPDPYRWLEDGATDEVRRWQRAQNDLASATVRAWPGSARLRELVDEHTTARFGAVPTWAGGLWFRSHLGEGATQASIVASPEPFGDGRVVHDPRLDESGSMPYLSWFSPAPDGRVLAVGLCYDGSEQNTIRLVDVESGKPLPGAPTERLMDGWSGGVSWLPDSSGFYFTALDGAAIDVSHAVFFHRLADATTGHVDVPWTTTKDYRMVLPSRDGRRVVAVERLMSPIPVAVADLDDPVAPRWRPFVDDTTASVAGHLVGDRYVAVTDLDAPRGRLVAVDVAHPEPESWTTLVPESDAVLRTVYLVGDVLYLSEFVDTYARVRIVDLEGTKLGEVPLPGSGALSEQPFPYMNLPRGAHPDEFVFSFSTLTSSWGVYMHRPGDAKIDVLEEPAVTLAGAVVEDRWATSRDGTRIPYHLVRPRDADVTTPQPTLVYAYGGFNAPWVPQFPSAMAAFVAAGGTFVHAHLRGGAEFGREWWEGGRLGNKQNCYDDLYAVAEHLVAEGSTTHRQLALTGGSNGGLMSGVAVTQRPDLWAAVVPRVPLLDVLGACREAYGRYAVTTEFADVDDADEVRRLLTFSPYQLVEEREYPAVFVDAGDTDPRCSPWHARKFAARLQHAQQGDAPVLLHVWENVGHGWATGKQVTVDQTTEWLGFVLDRLGMRP